jgi:positive regulator of sigma E activity
MAENQTNPTGNTTSKSNDVKVEGASNKCLPKQSDNCNVPPDSALQMFVSDQVQYISERMVLPAAIFIFLVPHFLIRLYGLYRGMGTNTDIIVLLLVFFTLFVSIAYLIFVQMYDPGAKPEIPVGTLIPRSYPNLHAKRMSVWQPSGLATVCNLFVLALIAVLFFQYFIGLNTNEIGFNIVVLMICVVAFVRKFLQIHETRVEPETHVDMPHEGIVLGGLPVAKSANDTQPTVYPYQIQADEPSGTPPIFIAASGKGNPKSAIDAYNESIEWADEPAAVVVKNPKDLTSPIVKTLQKTNELLEKQNSLIENNTAPRPVYYVDAPKDATLKPEDCPVEGKGGFWVSQEDYAIRIKLKSTSLTAYRKTSEGVRW